jgi:hypothetical protein
MIMSSAGLRPKNDYAGEVQQQLQTTDPSSCQSEYPISTNLQLSDNNNNLVMGPNGA